MNKVTHYHPPAVGGVRDFATLLAARMPNHRAEALEKNGKVPFDRNCVLHYSGYGYARRGAPLWLLRKIELERERIESLTIQFHELYATSGPLGSAFWLSPVQWWIAARLAQLSDSWMTSQDRYEKWLSQRAPNKPHVTLPVFSNVGESVTSRSDRSRRIVVFGSAAVRQRTYRTFRAYLAKWIEEGYTLDDIGQPMPDGTFDDLPLRAIHRHGRVNERQVGELLSSAVYGLLDYDIAYVAKSSIFAAYCAHGMCPVLASASYEVTDGLQPEINFLPLKSWDPVISHASSVAVGAAAWRWYQNHQLTAHVRAISTLTQLPVANAKVMNTFVE